MDTQKLDLIVKATGTSETATLLTLVKCAIGSGLLALPFAFMLSGFLGGTLLLVVVAIFDFYSWRLMTLTL
jgi:amino acid permease